MENYYIQNVFKKAINANLLLVCFRCVINLIIVLMANL